MCVLPVLMLTLFVSFASKLCRENLLSNSNTYCVPDSGAVLSILSFILWIIVAVSFRQLVSRRTQKENTDINYGDEEEVNSAPPNQSGSKSVIVEVMTDAEGTKTTTTTTTDAKGNKIVEKTVEMKNNSYSEDTES
ncbi:predicted protein [Phaeodactylum tricornutum CCAP 1055/1]|uniref:Uncharacterized protein n=1 Tax=Phaeodactylum tricornutum (strain CCAP 1055/1) TaxID=556484 RepID=B7GED3_PHATC|nr:predicted protein [Phaeodactylum tricornutum CCAP 1055/1]XP_002185415.1 predicted protein [Phaeodactylum tricornutum CCAP 1055/1]EEC42870.1 predicted protein [Phaeodactylum tricornutum CCAP 1055/1]EEC43084.1 predicted protein [Phaeodactylum tricornutum CCAP 1055/1]|eukprot:XP_002176143.1 predicted protein [Phaeodactylum tricornutum CCAP 1055/1]